MPSSPYVDMLDKLSRELNEPNANLPRLQGRLDILHDLMMDGGRPAVMDMAEKHLLRLQKQIALRWTGSMQGKIILKGGKEG